MNKTLILLLALVCSLSAFSIVQNEKAVKAINWPFTTCGNGDWTIEKLTLASQPARNANNDIDVVNIL